MNIKKIKLLGSNYVGLFSITNDKLCFVPKTIEDKTAKIMETVLDAKIVKASIYNSSLLAVFSRMNNKEIFLPSYTEPSEIEEIEKEIKVRIIQTEHALGNLLEINDTHALLSKTLNAQDVKQIKESDLNTLQMNLAKTDAIGSSILLTNNSFLISSNASMEEVKKIQQELNISGGASTANTGDAFIRNSVIANKTGVLVGERTTGHEIARIDEALDVQSKK
jgi:translation initiation factor 6